jgi:hypothetical protein
MMSLLRISWPESQLVIELNDHGSAAPGTPVGTQQEIIIYLFLGHLKLKGPTLSEAIRIPTLSVMGIMSLRTTEGRGVIKRHGIDIRYSN